MDKTGIKPNEKRGREDCLTVSENTELLQFLLAQMPAQSRNNIKSLLAHGQISVDNLMITQFNHPLTPGQKVTINWGKIQEGSGPQGLRILFEDPHLIVIEKQAGLLSIATEKEKEHTAYSILTDYLRNQDPSNRIFIVHRLDRETSGVMMFAKSQAVQQKLQDNWKTLVLERSYMVVVEGSIKKDQGTVTSWLKESKSLVMYSSPKPTDGKKAVTHYKVLKSNKNCSLLEVHLETGRKNQIRAHMQEIGHSVIGDRKYGARSNPIHRLGLHAHVLAFIHPVTGETLRFETSTPKDFLQLLSRQQGSKLSSSSIVPGSKRH